MAIECWVTVFAMCRLYNDQGLWCVINPSNQDFCCKRINGNFEWQEGNPYAVNKDFVERL